MATHPQLADLGYRQISPTPALRPFVQCYWLLEGKQPVTAGRQELLHPDGGTGINFNLGGRMTVDGWLPVNGVRFDGVNRRSYTLELAGRPEAFGVRFLPGGAHRLFGIPMDELALRNLDATTVLPEFGGNWLERLMETETLVDRLRLVEHALLRRLSAAVAPSPLIQQGLAEIAATRGQSRIQSLADRIGVSGRQLERAFARHVGLSPKTYARLIRVRHARAAIKQRNGAALVDIALDTGFFDQAHFVRDFKAVVGMAPAAYGRRRTTP